MCEEGTEGRLRQLHEESLDGFINVKIFFFLNAHLTTETFVGCGWGRGCLSTGTARRLID